MLTRILDADRRQASRYRLQLPVLFTWADDREVHTQGGFTRDISVNGLLIVCPLAPPPRTTMRIEVLLPGLGHMPENSIRARGQVVRAFESNKWRGVAIAAQLCEDFMLEKGSDSADVVSCDETSPSHVCSK